jgi:hypothetical protein
MLVVVSDSSPIIYLTRLGLLPLLPLLHDTVVVPQAVWQEIVVGGSGLPESENLRKAAAEGWIQVREIKALRFEMSAEAAALGRGELEAISLAQELGAILLTDDSDARLFALRRGLKVSGTVGLLIRAKTNRQLAAVKPLLDQLRGESNFRMSEQLYAVALKECGEWEEPMLPPRES